MNEIQYGIIIKGLGGLYEVKTNDNIIIKCKAKGLLRHEKMTPYAGDNVVVRQSDNGSVIEKIVDRKNHLIRPPVANLDNLFVVIAATKPYPVLSITDKLISIAEYNHIEPIIIISKSDLDNNEAERIFDIYFKSGFNVYISGIDKDKKDLYDFVIKHAKGKISAFAGASGVGKSTVLNAIFPKLTLETGEISHKTERGKHTTRHVELFGLECLCEDTSVSGYIADTPGFSLIDFTKFDFYKKDDVVYTFREFQEYIGTCKYTKCSHTAEDGCKIIEAVKNGIISSERHNSYVEIYNILKDKHDWK